MLNALDLECELGANSMLPQLLYQKSALFIVAVILLQ